MWGRVGGDGKIFILCVDIYVMVETSENFSHRYSSTVSIYGMHK